MGCSMGIWTWHRMRQEDQGWAPELTQHPSMADAQHPEDPGCYGERAQAGLLRQQLQAGTPWSPTMQQKMVLAVQGTVVNKASKVL